MNNLTFSGETCLHFWRSNTTFGLLQLDLNWGSLWPCTKTTWMRRGLDFGMVGDLKVTRVSLYRINPLINLKSHLKFSAGVANLIDVGQRASVVLSPGLRQTKLLDLLKLDLPLKTTHSCQGVEVWICKSIKLYTKDLWMTKRLRSRLGGGDWRWHQYFQLSIRIYQVCHCLFLSLYLDDVSLFVWSMYELVYVHFVGWGLYYIIMS